MATMELIPGSRENRSIITAKRYLAVERTDQLSPHKNTWQQREQINYHNKKIAGSTENISIIITKRYLAAERTETITTKTC